MVQKLNWIKKSFLKKRDKNLFNVLWAVKHYFLNQSIMQLRTYNQDRNFYSNHTVTIQWQTNDWPVKHLAIPKTEIIFEVYLEKYATKIKFYLKHLNLLNSFHFHFSFMTVKGIKQNLMPITTQCKCTLFLYKNSVLMCSWFWLGCHCH